MAGYDKFMVAVDAAHNSKIRRLKRAGKDARWAWFHGVLPIAASAPMRGSFCVGELAADADDVAGAAEVSVGEARKTLQVAREIGLLERDEEGVEWVHDFEDYNPEPKRDSTSPDRSRRYRERQRAKRHGTVTAKSHRDGRDANGPVTPPEVEGEEEVEAELRSVRAARRSTVDPDSLPDDLPDALVAIVDTATARLAALWQQRGGHAPTRRGTALAVRRFPDRDHGAVLDELENWATVGRGARKTIKDWPKTFATFLDNTTPARPTHLRPVTAAGDFDKYDVGIVRGEQHSA